MENIRQKTSIVNLTTLDIINPDDGLLNPKRYSVNFLSR